MQNILSRIPNQVNIADDILIGVSQQEHDNTLHQVVSALAQYGITVNPKKCIIMPMKQVLWVLYSTVKEYDLTLKMLKISKKLTHQPQKKNSALS